MRRHLIGWIGVALGLGLLGGCGGTPSPPATMTPQPTPQPTAPPPATATPSPATVTPTPRPTPTPTPTAATVRVDPGVTYQTLDGIGAASYAFPYANDVGWEWDAVKFVFDELDLAYVRLAPWMGWWETFNDNDDPYTINWDGFGTVHDIINHHDVPYAQFLHAQGIELAVGVWNFAGVSEWCETCEDWLAAGDPRTIPPALYPEMGESISAYILNMRAHGVPLAVAEVQNEPDIQAGIKYPSPEALRDAGRVLVAMLDHFGLEDVMLHAPNLHSPRGNVPWIEVWFDDPVLRERTVAVSYHTWWSRDRRTYEEIWAAAQRYDKPVWATEVGYHEGGDAIMPNTWRTSWDYAQSFYRAIAWSHASRAYSWTILGNDAAVGKQGERYPMFYVLKHFANYIPAGAVLIESAPDDDRLLSLAFARPDGAYSVIVLNTHRRPRAFALAGLPAPVVEAVTSTDGAYEVPLTPDAGGAFTVPAQSVTSLVLRPPAVSE